MEILDFFNTWRVFNRLQSILTRAETSSGTIDGHGNPIDGFTSGQTWSITVAGLQGWQCWVITLFSLHIAGSEMARDGIFVNASSVGVPMVFASLFYPIPILMKNLYTWLNLSVEASNSFTFYMAQWVVKKFQSPSRLFKKRYRLQF